MNADNEKLDKISQVIIGAAFQVGNTLGPGFLEKVYENALVHELKKRGLRAEQQRPIKVVYGGVVVGDYSADILVEDEIIVELKAVNEFDEVHMAQCLNYLKATGLRVCLLLNFAQPRVEVKRIVNNF